MAGSGVEGALTPAGDWGRIHTDEAGSPSGRLTAGCPQATTPCTPGSGTASPRATRQHCCHEASRAWSNHTGLLFASPWMLQYLSDAAFSSASHHPHLSSSLVSLLSPPHPLPSLLLLFPSLYSSPPPPSSSCSLLLFPLLPSSSFTLLLLLLRPLVPLILLSSSPRHPPPSSLLPRTLPFWLALHQIKRLQYHCNHYKSSNI